MNIKVYDPNAITRVVVDITARKIASAEAGKAALAAIEGDQRIQGILDKEKEVDLELEVLRALEDHESIVIHLRTLTNASRLELSTAMAACGWSGSGHDELMSLISTPITEIEGHMDVIKQMDGGMSEFLSRIVDNDIQQALVRAVADHCTMPVDAEKN